jgi:hypothetical protein
MTRSRGRGSIRGDVAQRVGGPIRGSRVAGGTATGTERRSRARDRAAHPASPAEDGGFSAAPPRLISVTPAAIGPSEGWRRWLNTKSRRCPATDHRLLAALLACVAALLAPRAVLIRRAFPCNGARSDPINTAQDAADVESEVAHSQREHPNTGLDLRPGWRRVVPAIPGSCGSSLRASPAGSSGRCRGGSLRRWARTLRGSRPGPRRRGRRRS